jgi:hypothetical protein
MFPENISQDNAPAIIITKISDSQKGFVHATGDP